MATASQVEFKSRQRGTAHAAVSRDFEGRVFTDFFDGCLVQAMRAGEPPKY